MERPSPDELLRRLEPRAGGRLKVFLGYASRSGKSMRMFEEGLRRKSRGQDVIVGAVQPRGSKDLESVIARFEVIPLKGLDVDVDAILCRRPQVCLIDELANRERWKDVEQIRCAGIHVVTAIDLRYIEPDSVLEGFIRGGDELVLVDAPGANNELRERALLLAAEIVEEQLSRYMEAHGITQNWGTQERILVCITERSNARAMLESGSRAAALFHGHLLALHIGASAVSEAVRAKLDLARELGADVHMIEGCEPVGSILHFAREHRVTQIFVGHSLQSSWKFWKPTPVAHLIREAEGIDVRLFPQPNAAV